LTDITSKIENILAVCTKRTANISYFQLGDKDGNTIQKNDGTYYIEKFNTHKQKRNAMSRAYIYDKRKKELDKFKRDIGFNLTRFELKLQKRFFVKNEYSGSVMDKALQKYTVLFFEDMLQKRLFIQTYNEATTRKKRKNVIDALEGYSASILTPRLNNQNQTIETQEIIKKITNKEPGDFNRGRGIFKSGVSSDTVLFQCPMYDENIYKELI